MCQVVESCKNHVPSRRIMSFPGSFLLLLNSFCTGNVEHVINNDVPSRRMMRGVNWKISIKGEGCEGEFLKIYLPVIVK